jgi:type II secretory pathway pseudopilin PulG
METGNSAERRRPAAAPSGADGGFIMVILIVAMGVSAVWMGALLPAWRQQVIREREAELIFRGEQYARAIYLYRQKNNQISPPTIDVLVSQHYLRKKYLDPITGKEFLPLGGLSSTGGSTGGGGITGVRSTSNDTSIVIYKTQQTYSQFPFDWSGEAQRAGGGINTVPGGGRQGPGGVGVGNGGGVQAPRGTGPGSGGPGGPRGAGPGGGVQQPRGNGPGPAPAPGGGRGGTVTPGGRF